MMGTTAAAWAVSPPIWCWIACDLCAWCGVWWNEACVLCCRRSTHLDIQVLTPEGLKVRCSKDSTSADAGYSSNCADTTSQVDSSSRRP
jgi:hypothetical protein